MTENAKGFRNFGILARLTPPIKTVVVLEDALM
jgi:hypothetical protein